VVVGIFGEYDAVSPEDARTGLFAWMALECAPLVLAADGVAVIPAPLEQHEIVVEQTATFPWRGELYYESICPPTTVLTELRVRAGYWLDGVQLGCAALHL
jgi:hypothetical protein